MHTKRLWIFISLILVSVFATRFVQSVLSQEHQKPKARISGRVVSTAGKPLAGVTIWVSGRGSGGGMVKTDEGGQYSLEVEPGTYYVRGERRGYISASYKLEDSASEAIPLTVEAGQHLSSINFRLSKGGVITGRILDERGEPLVGEEVSVTPKEKQQFAGSYGRTPTTDDRGIYRIYGLPSGTYYVGVQVQEEKLVSYGGGRMRTAQSRQVTYYPGVTSLAEASEVTVTEGVETTGIDFKLRAGSSEGARIFGSVTNGETRQPMAGSMVTAYQTEHSMTRFQAVCDSDGQYEMKGLPSGKYMVQVFDPRMFDSDQELAPPLAQEVTVERDALELNFAFERGGQISGQIMLEGNRVPKGVAEFFVSLRPIGGSRFIGGMRPPRPDSQGHFTVKAIPTGVYRLDVAHNNAPYYLKSVILDNADVKESGIPVESGSEIRDVLVVLSDAGATLRGRVIGEKGPLPGVFVSLVSVDILTAQAPELASQSGAMSDQRGQFEIKTIRPGRYFVFAYQVRPAWRGTEAFIEFLRSHQGQLQVVDLKANETKELDVTLLATGQP